MNLILNHGFTYINYIVFTAWIIWGLRDALKSHYLMEETANRYDKNREFVARFGVNLYSINIKHNKITPEFLNEWKLVYRGYWTRARWHFALLFLYGMFSGVIRYLIDLMFYKF